MVVTSGATFSGTVATTHATPLGVRVLDAEDRPVPGVLVRFMLLRGSGSLDPQSAMTNANGEASSRLLFGPIAGSYDVLASVTGVEISARFTGNAAPGTVDRVVLTPGQVRLDGVGDSSRFRARQYDAHGNIVPGATVVWSSADPDVFTIEQNGVVWTTRSPAVGRAIATVGTRSDTGYVVISSPEVSPCLGYSPAVSLAVGQSVDMSMTDGVCIRSAGGDDEYVVVPWYGSTSSSATVTLQLMGSGLATVPTAALLAPTPSLASAPATVDAPTRAFALERRIREVGRREILPLARRLQASRGDRNVTTDSRRAIPTSLSPGQFIELNTNPTVSCTAPSMRTGRVAAVTTRAIVIHDTTNPAGGFTDADYLRFGITFDTLVAPVDEAAFGTPTDIDQNGKVVIFFTRAVNELTPSGSTFYYGGFFHPRDLLPKQRDGATVCAGSNEGEMFYMLVPDPDGVVNGNRRRVGFVDSVTIATLGHEYQHLINAGRRAFVNDAADEEVWLNEGLSHIAEELLFYRATGTGPRQNLGAERFGTPLFDGLFTEYMASNFGRLQAFLQAPHNFSPYGSGDELGTRGAIWAFLRYAADRRAAADGDVWSRLVNSRAAGIANLQAVFGANVGEMVRDWIVSLYTDDYVSGTALTLTQPSWNFRAAYPALPTSRRPYPLTDAVRSLPEASTQTVSLRAGSGAFLRFAVVPGREASIRVTSNGLAPPAAVRATIVRRR
jgi:hypothetical protein